MVSDTWKDRNKGEKVKKRKPKKKDPSYSPSSPILEVNTEEDVFLEHLDNEEGE